MTENERRYIIQLLKNDSQNLATHFEFEFVIQALTDYKTYVQTGIFTGYVNRAILFWVTTLIFPWTISILIPVYTLSFFTPTIINELGFSAANAQLLSVPPFVAGCISTVLVGIYSDIVKLRGPFVIAGALVSIVGYIILYTQTSPGLSYVGAVLASAGVFPVIIIDIVWAGSNAGGDMKRGVVIATVIGFGNLGG